MNDLLYLDLFSGVSGDMWVGALLDLGVDFEFLKQELDRLRLGGYTIQGRRGEKQGITGTKFDVQCHAHSHHGDGHSGQGFSRAEAGEPSHAEGHGGHSHERNFLEIEKIIARSDLSGWVKGHAISIFKRIASAEAKIHGRSIEEVHFHEVGAVDSIVDIIAACVGLESLGRPRLLASPVTDGRGWIDCAHGRFPAPAPATLEILAARDIPLTQCDEPFELVTPTGAALLAEFVEEFGPMRLIPRKIGYGLGTRDLSTRPNLLRAILGAAAGAPQTGAAASTHDWETDTIAVLETNLDDIQPEILGNFMERALSAGALDVFHTAIQMKKSRPGVLLTLLCEERLADVMAELILRETSAFGVRRHATARQKLRREWVEVETSLGQIPVKLGKLDGEIIQAAPEYEGCKAAADRARVPLKTAYDAAKRAWQRD